MTLPGTTIETSVLGYGCNRLLGPRTRAEALALLETAYDAGIRHFDVARSYGYGDAERLVGEFASSRRDEITITTKFGLQPLKKGTGLRATIGLARRLMRLAPFVRNALGAQARKLIKSGAFSVDEARDSLDTSVRELQTDRVDVLLLHGWKPSDVLSSALFEFLQSAVDAGRIRAFGVGSEFVNVQALAQTRPEFCRVAQFESSALDCNIECLDPATNRAIVTHGALSGSWDRLRTYLAARPEFARTWSRVLDLDCTDPTILTGLMLTTAVRANPDGLVLFSSTNPRSIVANVRAVADKNFAPEQITKFRELVRDVP